MNIIISCCVCGKSGKSLLKCSVCHQAHYCSKNCQREDWSRHKLICNSYSYKEVKSEREILTEIIYNVSDEIYLYIHYWQAMKPNKLIGCLVETMAKYSYVLPGNICYFCTFLYMDKTPNIRLFKEGINIMMVYSGKGDKDDGLSLVTELDKNYSLEMYNILNKNNYYKDYKLPLTFTVNIGNTKVVPIVSFLSVPLHH